ncbi:MAG: flagellar type III secretion system pore protein FliP [Oscillospiraceae bacterium]|jgi:flagellar biosynthetic protein FliP|nr:flagellar type III secretion system pore protein FliP [Oscillospiraceae bacterium]
MKRALRFAGTLLPLMFLLLVLFSSQAQAVGLDPEPPAEPAAPGAADEDNPGTDTTEETFPFSFLQGLLGEDTEGATTTVEIMLLLTVLTLVPSILIMMTSFTRIVIVLSFTRNAMGTQNMPPNQIIIGLALFLTYFSMHGTLTQIYDEAWVPYQQEESEMTLEEFYTAAVEPLREFMFTQIRGQGHVSDLGVFMGLAGLNNTPPEDLGDVPTYVLIPAFITSELKTGLWMGFFIYIPFIVIDMIVASALMSMGMMMLPPAMISMPFKLMIFVLANGWDNVVLNLIRSFTGGS